MIYALCALLGFVVGVVLLPAWWAMLLWLAWLTAHGRDK